MHYVMKKRLEILTVVLFWIRQVRACNQLFHVGVLPFSKENQIFFLSVLPAAEFLTPANCKCKRKRNKNKLSILKYSFFNFKLTPFSPWKLSGFFLTENFYLNFATVDTASYSGGRRPSHCTQVTQCMWGFAIWIQFSLPPCNKCGVNPGRPWQQKINLIHE